MQEKQNRGIEPCFDFLDEFSGTFPWQNSRIFDHKINVRFFCSCHFPLGFPYGKRRCYSFTQQSLPYPKLTSSHVGSNNVIPSQQARHRPVALNDVMCYDEGAPRLTAIGHDLPFELQNSLPGSGHPSGCEYTSVLGATIKEQQNSSRN